MILAVDVHYEDHAANAACVGFRNWPDTSASLELVERSKSAPEPYEPGQFYKRELPHLLRIIDLIRHSVEVEAVIIDGHVWLNEHQPGLGAHLYHALGDQIVVVGVAKSQFRGGAALPSLRGQSRQPLFITAVGMETSRAAELVRGMHGPHRIPTLLKRVDHLARRTLRPGIGLAGPAFELR